MADIFLSYAREDQARIEALVSALQEQGWSIFWDRHIPAGQTWRSHIGEALRDARCVVVAWSHHSVSSRWVIEEAEDGQQRGILVPVMLDDVELPIGFRGIQAGDLRDWQPGRASAQFSQLVHDIGAFLSAAPKSSKTAPTGTKAAAAHVERPGVPPPQKARARSRILGGLAMIAILVVIAGVGYWGYDRTRSASSSQSSGSRDKSGAGRVKTADRSFQFDKITGMSMGVGQFTVTQFGSRVDIPIEKIARVRFLPKNTVMIQYKDGASEEVEFSCYWNAPVTFHVGEKEIYYGDCTALRAIKEIEFFH
ncbi:MAG: TIR domain-containing protein [Betaproteobacteria bacterium]|jgi:hypothetical protein|nr:TIR domain-containing protein [Betaproteobacteria bacterium]